MEGCHNYKMSTGTTYGEREQSMDIRKSNDNFKDRKPKYFNCNKYVIWQRNAKERRRNEKQELVLNVTRRDTLPKIIKETDMKKRKVQEELDKEDKEEKGFGEDLK